MSKLKIPRTSDKKIVAVFGELAVQFDLGSSRIVAISGDVFENVDIRAIQSFDNLKELLLLDCYLIGKINIKFNNNFHIIYCRGAELTNPSSIYDEIEFRNDSPQPGTQLTCFKIIAFITKKLLPFEPDRIIPGQGFEEQAQLSPYVRLVVASPD